MKKRVIALVVVLASIAIAPKIVAHKVAEQLNTSIAELNAVPGYIAQVQEFKSGWFASTAKIEISVDLVAMSPQTNLEEYSFPTEGTILLDFSSSHGPILFGTHTGIGWLGYTLSYSGDAARDTLNWTDSTALYTLAGTMGLLGESHFVDNITAFETTDAQAFSIDFSGYQGRGKYSHGEYIYSGASDKFEFDDVDGNLNITGLNIDVAMQGDIFEALKGVMFDSEINVGLNNITLTDVGGEPFFTIDDVKVDAVTSVDNQENLASGVFNYGVKAIDIMDYNINDIVLQMEMNRLSLEFLESYRIFTQEMVNFQPEEITDKTLEFLQNKLLPALTASPELNITDFHGTIPEGNFKASLYTEITGIDAVPGNMIDQAFWLQHLLVNADIELDKGVALMLAQQQLRSQLMQNPQFAEMSQEELENIITQQTPVMLNAFQEQGLIIETESKYTASFELKEGKAILNSNPIPIPGM